MAARPPQRDAALSRSPVPRRRLRWLLLAYLILLGISHGIRLREPAPVPLPVAFRSLSVASLDGDRRLERKIRLVLRRAGGGEPGRQVVVLLHGSPGSGRELQELASLLSSRYRVIVPDLPGFGLSERRLPDYSSRAHAGYVLQILESLKVPSAHIVGFSLGGAVALQLYDLAPDRVRSMTLLSATAVQELELLGDYHLNHLVHGLQLGALWGLREAFPHMGMLDGSFLGVAYARNFYDTDQRPLRGILERFEPPMLIVHGENDALVPAAAAREHHRIVPQSELVMLPANHFMTFSAPDRIVGPLVSFLQQVDDENALHRSAASASRLASAAVPFDPRSVPQVVGPALLSFLLLIALATLVSEDLTCIGVGIMVAQGRIGFVAGAVACFVGIYVGDLLLYLAGRYLGRPVVARAPFRWFLGDAQLETAAEWFRQRGPVVIGLSRFLPGARLPTYVAAGVLRTSFWSFSLWFFVAAGVWTPLLVALASLVGAKSLQLLKSSGTSEHLLLLALVVALLIAVRVGVRLLTHRGRRLLVSRWRRITRWEFWPQWAFYPPVVLYVLWLGLRYRGLTVFTAANPAMPAGGFVGESKGDILAALQAAGAPVADFGRIAAALTPQDRVARAREFMASRQKAFPVVLKPDAGERGSGVAVVRGEEELRAYLHAARSDVLIQEYVPGCELGVFYCRVPGEARGRIFSITEKRMPVVVGDGRRKLEQLILDDPRAVCMSRIYLQAQRRRLQEVPCQGEKVQLVELGTHCLGALFLDGGRLRTEALEEAVERMSRGYAGFYFGRYDLRAPTEDDFRQGRNMWIIELNGVTSESTDIYDPKNSLLAAYQVLFRQWRLAFEIGAANRRAGVVPAGAFGLLRLLSMRGGTKVIKPGELGS